MKIDDTGRIVEFAEKPKGDTLQKMKVDTSILGLSPERYLYLHFLKFKPAIWVVVTR